MPHSSEEEAAVKQAAMEKKFAETREKEWARDGTAEKPGNLVNLLITTTDQYVSEEQKKQVQKEIDQEKVMKVATEKRIRAERLEEKKKRNANKGKNTFEEGWHIYSDSTGFRYDIKLTKAATRGNRNEQHELIFQIYESDALIQSVEFAHRGRHHTYATNLYAAATEQLPSNNIIDALGCNLPTAYRLFCKAFQEQTGIKWEDRVTYAIAREEREKRLRGAGTGGPVEDDEIQRVIATSESAEVDKKLYVYHPPVHGPRGKMPVVGEDIHESLVREQKRRDVAAAAASAAEKSRGAGRGDEIVEVEEESCEQEAPPGNGMSGAQQESG